MDENELRAALRTTITQHPEPPPMQSRTAIDAGRRAARRRNLLAGGGTAAAVLAVTLAVISGQSSFDQGGTGIQAAGNPAASVAPDPFSMPSPGPSLELPTRPRDEDKADKLLDELVKVAPAGYTVLDGTVGNNVKLRSQSGHSDRRAWAYITDIPLRKGNGTGQLRLDVHEPGNSAPEDVCEATERLYPLFFSDRPCTKQTVGGAEVGVITDTAGMMAVYRHTDGTVVVVMQFKDNPVNNLAGFKPLAELPLSKAGLAALATDSRFR
ncbi:hypothetical protein [Actinoplanes sp. NPDC051859]|uniref:hypothetical protein n=1 Tax=Actinoplanes sp. NPDC051859 TaxID=3363909 RepID=UPI003799B27A